MKTTSQNINNTVEISKKQTFVRPIADSGLGRSGTIIWDGRRLSEHFALSEFVRSAVAIRHHLPNVPDAQVISALRHLCDRVLEPLRLRFGVIRITSGYRSPVLNRLVGGASHSQHVIGEAVDIHVSCRAQAERMAHFIIRYLPYDQVIIEEREHGRICWLHVSCKVDETLNRRQLLCISR